MAQLVQMIMPLALTVLCALAMGVLLDRMHLPGGMMVGAVIGSCLLGVWTQQSYMPSAAKTLAQQARLLARGSRERTFGG